MGRADVANNVGLFNILPKIDRNAAATIVGANVSDFHGAAFVIDAGAHTSGTGFTVTLQHRDGTGSWADIPNGELYGDKTANNIELVVGDANKKYYVGYSGNKEQIGALLTRDGSGVMVVGVSIVTGHPTVIPAINR
jgi:hypothetical protein